MPTVIEKKPVVDVSIERLTTLHPKIRESAIRAYEDAVNKTPKGIHPVVNEGLRSFERSNYLYSLGRTRKGNIVTKAKAGQSFHNYGLAIDFFLTINGKEVWGVNEHWLTVVACFKKEGFKWGGDFMSFKDYPHLEKTLGYTWKQLSQLYYTGKVDANGYVLL